jgi:hypothetical protein
MVPKEVPNFDMKFYAEEAFSGHYLANLYLATCKGVAVPI